MGNNAFTSKASVVHHITYKREVKTATSGQKIRNSNGKGKFHTDRGNAISALDTDMLKMKHLRFPIRMAFMYSSRIHIFLLINYHSSWHLIPEKSLCCQGDEIIFDYKYFPKFERI